MSNNFKIDSLGVNYGGFVRADEVLLNSIETIKNRRNGRVSGVITPWKPLNRVFGGAIEFGSNFILGARPGMGKSAIATILAFEIPLLNNIPIIILYWNWEMTNVSQGIRFFSNRTGKTVTQLKSAGYMESDSSTKDYQLDFETFNTLAHYSNTVKDINFFFHQQPVTAYRFEETVEAISKANPGFAIINIVDHTRYVKKLKEATEEERLTSLYMAGNRIKNSTGCINIFLSQLNRELERYIIEKSYRAPVNSDLFGADSAYQCADYMLLIHRPERYNVEEWWAGTDSNGKPVKIKTKDFMWGELVKNREGIEGTILFQHELKYNRIIDYVQK